MGKTWEHFSHGADIGIRGYGNNKTQAFINAALALTAVICEPEKVSATSKVEVCCEAPDDELLFVDWLNAIIYEMATRRFLFSRFELKLQDHMLKGEAWGEPVNVKKHEPAVEVKGATYTCLSVKQLADDTWLAQCVVDV